jgi:hypothetical protein
MFTRFHIYTTLWIVLNVTAVDKNKIAKQWLTRYLILMLTLTGEYSFRKPAKWVTPRVYELTNTIIYDVGGKPENWVTPRVYELTNTIIYDVVGIRISIKDYG